MNHIVLLGDSILDNAAYTAGGPSVLTHLQARYASTATVTLLAVDGSVTTDVLQQLDRLPANTTHVVVSAGGNNALMQSDFVSKPAQSVAHVLIDMSTMARTFEEDYQRMLAALTQRALPFVLCTVYDPHFLDPTVQKLMRTGLLPFNDVILRSAFQAGVPVIDLRFVCTNPSDYANEIEPSAQGGGKIADVIMRVIDEHNFSRQRTCVYF